MPIVFEQTQVLIQRRMKENAVCWYSRQDELFRKENFSNLYKRDTFPFELFVYYFLFRNAIFSFRRIPFLVTLCPTMSY